MSAMGSKRLSVLNALVTKVVIGIGAFLLSSGASNCPSGGSKLLYGASKFSYGASNQSPKGSFFHIKKTK